MLRDYCYTIISPSENLSFRKMRSSFTMLSRSRLQRLCDYRIGKTVFIDVRLVGI